MARFELVTDYKDCPELLPKRATDGSAGYDFFVAENMILFPYEEQMNDLFCQLPAGVYDRCISYSLTEVEKMTKATQTRPQLVPTGIKCKLDAGTFLQLSVRSSCPLKYWLILANGVGIIDYDYYGNESNEGHIFFQIINLSPFRIELHRGDRIGQGIILPYLTTEDDEAGGVRVGGMGSTSA